MKNRNNPVLFLTGGDPWGAPTGGQTTFAKHLLTAFGSKLAVTSHCYDPNLPVGKWIIRPYKNNEIWFFNRGMLKKGKNLKPLIPSRVKAFFRAKKFVGRIREKEFDGLLIDSPEILFATMFFPWKSVCYSFAGVNNPVSNSRYRWARILGGLFEKFHVSSLKLLNPDVMIAAADKEAICEFHQRTGYLLNTGRFHQFPTRVDTDLFHPIPLQIARQKLGLPSRKKIFVTTGRLCWIKGWDFLLDSFALFLETCPDSMLIFVGDGEDQVRLIEKAKKLGILDYVRVTGFVPQSDVVSYMNAANVCLVSSHREGWSVAMCEMIACGKAVVSTAVSGAHDMVKNGANGFIVPNRDPREFSAAMNRALGLQNALDQSLRLAERYSVKYLADELAGLWPPLIG